MCLLYYIIIVCSYKLRFLCLHINSVYVPQYWYLFDMDTETHIQSDYNMFYYKTYYTCVVNTILIIIF